MIYDFDTVVDRRNTYSLKWDVAENELPMWVADMDFLVAPEIRDAIFKRFENGIFGYSVIPPEWALAYVNWWRTRHNFEIDPSWLVFCTGVVPAISCAVRKFTTPNENVVIQTPVYNIFFNSIVNNGRRVLESPLIYRDGQYSMDFEDLESKLSDPQTTMMILCNPHNPVGRIWDRETLATVGALCKKHGVLVLSDEIHCDITAPGSGYVPFASVDCTCRDISITAIAPTKAFNIAGIQSAAVLAANPFLRHKITRALNTDEIAEPNVFAVPTAIAAFTQGGPWLDQFLSYVFENRRFCASFLSEHLPQLHLVPAEATYLLWIDCSKVTEDSVAFAKMIREKTGLFVSNGTQYGQVGRCFLRVNIACPRSLLTDGLTRLEMAIKG